MGKDGSMLDSVLLSLFKILNYSQSANVGPNTRALLYNEIILSIEN